VYVGTADGITTVNKEIPDRMPEHLEKARKASKPKFRLLYCSRCHRETTHRIKLGTHLTQPPFKYPITDGYWCNLCYLYPERPVAYSTTKEMRKLGDFGRINFSDAEMRWAGSATGRFPKNREGV
jgi:hypothetical protein